MRAHRHKPPPTATMRAVYRDPRGQGRWLARATHCANADAIACGQRRLAPPKDEQCCGRRYQTSHHPALGLYRVPARAHGLSQHCCHIVCLLLLLLQLLLLPPRLIKSSSPEPLASCPITVSLSLSHVPSNARVGSIQSSSLANETDTLFCETKKTTGAQGT